MDMRYDLDLDLDNICRICLTQQEKFVNLFSTHIVDGYIRTMPFIVQYCLDITVDEQDLLPKKICESCKSTIINYYTFKERCKRTESVLLETFQKSNQISNIVKIEDSPEDIIQIENIINESHDDLVEALDVVTSRQEIDTESQINLSILDRTSDSSSTKRLEEDSIIDDALLVSDNFSEVNEPVKTIEYLVDLPDNGICKDQYEYLETNMAESVIQEEKGDEEEEADEAEEEVSLIAEDFDDIFEIKETESYLCELCQKEFSKDSFVEHCRCEHAMCSFCFATFDTDKQLIAHEKKEHTLDVMVRTWSNKKHGNNSLLCHLCNKRWGNAEQLNQHMKFHEALNIFMDNKYECHECRHCHTVYLKVEDLENHMSIHENAKSSHADDAFCTDYQFLDEDKPFSKYTCGFCKTPYETMEEMRLHIIIHFDSFSCPFDACGFQYETFSRLSRHIMQKHVNAEEHFCTHCQNERFATFDDLQKHIRNDCPAKKFLCSHCDKKFFSKKALQLHLKHLSKKYQCTQCSKSFAQPGELTLHLRTHTGEKPFKCTVCFKQYRTASMRAAHMDAHIEGKTYQCTVCSKSLQTRTSYRNHMKRHTNGKSYKCSECVKSFYTKYHLDIHQLKIHNKAKGS